MAWTDGEIAIVLRNLLGVRRRDGGLLLVAPYVKEPEMTQEPADILLFLMDTMIDEILPDATPVLWTPAAPRPSGWPSARTGGTCRPASTGWLPAPA